MCRWEAFNGRCEPCLALPANQALMAFDRCVCGHPGWLGWHLSAADPRTLLPSRCPAYWARTERRVRDRKTGEMVTVAFRVSAEDPGRLEVVRVEREDYG